MPMNILSLLIILALCTVCFAQGIRSDMTNACERKGNPSNSKYCKLPMEKDVVLAIIGVHAAEYITIPSWIAMATQRGIYDKETRWEFPNRGLQEVGALMSVHFSGICGIILPGASFAVLHGRTDGEDYDIICFRNGK